MPTEKQKIKVSLCISNMIIYVENLLKLSHYVKCVRY